MTKKNKPAFEVDEVADTPEGSVDDPSAPSNPDIAATVAAGAAWSSTEPPPEVIAIELTPVPEMLPVIEAVSSPKGADVFCVRCNKHVDRVVAGNPMFATCHGEVAELPIVAAERISNGERVIAFSAAPKVEE